MFAEEEVPVSDKSESHEDQNGNCTPTIRDEKDAFLSPEASEASRLRFVNCLIGVLRIT